MKYIVVFLSVMVGFWIDISLGFFRVGHSLSKAISPQLSVLVAAIDVQSKRNQSTGYSPYSYESFKRHGFSDAEAYTKAMLARESKEFQRQYLKTIFPSATEIMDGSLIDVVDVVRKHKNIDIPVTLLHCDVVETSDVAKVHRIASMVDGLTKFPAIILFPPWYQVNNAAKIHCLYHELSHYMQTCRHPDSYLGCDRVEIERDADAKGFHDMSCCACLEDAAENRSDECHEPLGYFGVTRIKAMIDQRERENKLGICNGHKKIFSGKGSTVELKDFLPHEAKR